MTTIETPRPLKSLRRLTADPAYIRRSRMLLVGESGAAVHYSTWWKIAMQGLQIGSTVALAGLFLLVIAGSFSAWSSLSPFRLTSLDPAALRAEAQAIDIQIQLSDIGYHEPKAELTAPVTTLRLAPTDGQPTDTEPSPSSTPIDTTDALLRLAQ